MGYYVGSNPNDGNFSVVSTHIENYEAALFSINGQLIRKKTGKGVLEFKNIKSAGIYLLRIVSEGELLGSVKVLVK